MLDLAGVMPGMRVLDAGCGNGIYLRVASDVQEQVQAAIDTNGTFRTAGDVVAFVCR